MAADMNININEEAIENISDRNTQEKGLDLIAWIPFNDQNPNMIVLLGQCACGKEWYSKRGEPDRYTNYLSFYRLNPIITLFIPYALVDFANQKFFQSDEITNTLLFERGRMLQYLSDKYELKGFESSYLVDKCIEFQENSV
ncbi:MAG: hypothetical protein AAF740_08525 [Bacteroidota bacterium]